MEKKAEKEHMLTGGNEEQATDANSVHDIPDPEEQRREAAQEAWNKEILENMGTHFPRHDTDICSTLYRPDQDKELYLCREAEDLILFATYQLFLRDQLIASLKEAEENQNADEEE